MKEQLKAIPGLVRAYGGLLDLGRRLRMRWWRLDMVRLPRIRAYLDTHSIRRLQIGTGPMHLDGWLNVDVVPVDARTIYMDATRPFPLPDGVFESVFSEHMIEHVTLEQARVVVREAFRVMRPGGRIRIATPHLGRLLDLRNAAGRPEAMAYLKQAGARYVPEAPSAAPGYLINHFVRAWGHLFIYDEQTMGDLLRGVGFTDVVEVSVGTSSDAALSGLESHGQHIGEDNNRYETLVMEGVKPGRA